MLKLIKYEFRKNRTGLIVMLLAAAALYLMAPLGVWLESEAMMVLSPTLLFLYAAAAYVYVLARGIAAYSGELSSKSGYLLMMIPRSAMSILFAKLLFSLLFALLMLAICALALVSAGTILLGEMYEIKGFFNIAKYALADTGIELSALMSTALFFALELLTSVLSLVAVGYLSATLSATALQNRRGRGFVSVAFFAAIYALMSLVVNLFTPAVDALIASPGEAVLAVLPAMIAQIALTILFTALSALLLRRKVCL